MWDDLQKLLDRQPCGKFSGVRVFELHPGKEWEQPSGRVVEESHGLHVHIATDRFYPIAVIRALASKVGFGRVHVSAYSADMLKQAKYLSKYVSKQLWVAGRGYCRLFWLKGVRLWARVGGFKGTRVKDIRKRSALGDFIRRVYLPQKNDLTAGQRWGLIKMICDRWRWDSSRMVAQMWGQDGHDALVFWDGDTWAAHCEEGAQRYLFNVVMAAGPVFEPLPEVPVEVFSEEPGQLYMVFA